MGMGIVLEVEEGPEERFIVSRIGLAREMEESSLAT